MLKFTAKMTVLLAMLGMAACATVPKDDPRGPSSVVEDAGAKAAPWHYPYLQRNISKTAYY